MLRIKYLVFIVLSILSISIGVTHHAEATTKNDKMILVSDLESGYKIDQEIAPYIATDFLKSIQKDHPTLLKSFPLFNQTMIGVDTDHGTNVLRRFALGLKPNERVKIDHLRLIPIVFNKNIAAAYELAIEKGVLIHNFSIGINPTLETKNSILEMDHLIRKSPQALFIVATGNEGVAEASKIGNFPQILAFQNLPHVIFTGNAREVNLYTGQSLQGTIESPYELTQSNWTAASRFIVCIGCESTTGAAAYFSRLVAYIQQSLLLNHLPHQNSNVLRQLERCLPRAYFTQDWNNEIVAKGKRFFYRPDRKFLYNVEQCMMKAALSKIQYFYWELKNYF